jgi:peptidoglycan/xylan/chitin deacetylase (PgdA/CDA1 family)
MGTVNVIRTRASAALKRMAGRVVRWHGIVGLNYHRIGDGRRSVFDRGLWSATEEDFDRQVRFLKQGFDVITPADIAGILTRLTNGSGRPGRHVLVTFDDGYADNYTAAFPILRSHGVPATFFVATGFIDEPALPWWDEIAWMVRTSSRAGLELQPHLPDPVAFDEPDRERAISTLLKVYKRLPTSETTAYVEAIGKATGTGRAPADAIDPRKLWMTWDMLREMYAGGMTIGGHTVHHPVLANLPRDEQASEISGCAKRLTEELGVTMTAFAYPVGSRTAFNQDTRICLEERGVQTAFAYHGGMRRLDRWDNYDIPRLAVEQSTSFGEFRAMVMFPWLE